MSTKINIVSQCLPTTFKSFACPLNPPKFSRQIKSAVRNSIPKTGFFSACICLACLFFFSFFFWGGGGEMCIFGKLIQLSFKDILF